MYGVLPKNVCRHAFGELLKQRQTLAREEIMASSSRILGDLRGGGWGGQHLSKRLTGIPFLQADSERVLQTVEA